MFKINGIRIFTYTNEGDYGNELLFSEGLNIIRGDNTSGKSSLFQGILYCLGFEELMKGKNANAMQYVYKDHIVDETGRQIPVYETYLLLEIKNQNNEVITIKRYVKSVTVDPKLVEVFFGNGITGNIKGLDSKFFFLHDGGSVTNPYTGFFNYLASFLNLTLPEVVTKDGKNQKIYLQQIAPSYLIEQKAGWSDFLSTIPYYGGITGIKGKVIEYTLNLDISERQKQKQEYIARRKNIENNWHKIYDILIQISLEVNGSLRGIKSDPSTMEDFGSIQILIKTDSQSQTLGEYNSQLFDELEELENISNKPSITIKQKISSYEEDLERKNEILEIKSIKYDDLMDSISMERARLGNYINQLEFIEDDLEKTRGAVKIEKLGASTEDGILSNICPTCKSAINDSLLPCDENHIPMRLEENLEYLKSQKKMLEVYIEALQKSIEKKEYEERYLKDELSNLRQEIRYLKRELISDERLPSFFDIAQKIRLEMKLSKFESLYKKFLSTIDEFELLYNSYTKLIAEDGKYKDDFSELDIEKLDYLEKTFRELLQNYGYQSERSFDKIFISKETYLPIVTSGYGETRVSYNIISHSSGSDMIRSIWAYTVALMRTSIHFNANHPGIIIFDEPKQQEASISDFRSFIKDLGSTHTGQIIVLASFENEDSSFNIVTEGVLFKLNKINGKLIKKLN
ncbi:hypothetical protein K2X92_06165 [Candidatus Gracilibacteria bacterium]|nr:hypothetical protein [Candidatus Gracilibacteria bacterium]